MNRSVVYPLALSGILILTLAAQSILLVAHMQAGVLDSIPGWLVNAVAIWFYLLGVLLFAGTFFNYSNAFQQKIFLLSGLTLSGSGIFLFQRGLVAESVVITGLGIAFFLSNWISSEKDWLVETAQWANLCVGIGFLLRPDFMLSGKEYLFFQPQILSSSFAILMLASAALGFALTRGTASEKYRAKVLAAPWIVWGGMFTTPFFPF